jgi:hypothetical protein
MRDESTQEWGTRRKWRTRLNYETPEGDMAFGAEKI